VKSENWGRARWPTNRAHKEGVYVLELINGTGELMKELERRLRVSEKILRYLVVRVDEELRAAERTRSAARCEPARPRARVTQPASRPTTTAASSATSIAMADEQRRGGGGGGRGRGGARGASADKGPGQRRSLFRRRKVCKFCSEKIDYIDYKDVRMLMPFVPDRGKISRAGFLACARRTSARCRPPSSGPAAGLVPYVTD